MKTDWSALEKYREPAPGTIWASYRGERFGAFLLRRQKGTLRVIASAGDGDDMPWEHVSVSCQDRCPTWNEMAFVKSLFWLPTETVMQLHVPEEDHISHHPYTLHLWAPLKVEIPRPPWWAVGPRARAGRP